MKQLSLDTTDCLVPAESLHDSWRRLEPERAVLADVVEAGGYDDERASINLPADQELVTQCVRLAATYKDADALVVIGIGGSNLGTLAVHEALNGKLYNAMHAPRVFFADTVDSHAMRDISDLVEAYARAGRRVVLCCVSESGTTMETIANFQVLHAILAKYKPHAEHDIVVISRQGSPLWKLAHDRGFAALAVPSNVGGRYSVLSAVGLFPLAVLGVDIHALTAGAKSMVERCLEDSLEKNPAALSAAIRFHHYQHGHRIHDLFLFASYLESIGKWYRQLFAESLGKKHDREGRLVHAGLTPTVSIGSTDLHSIGQLTLAGPQDKYLVLVSLRHDVRLTVPHEDGFGPLAGHVQGRDLHDIMDAILGGTQHALREASRPFATIVLPEPSAYCIGQLLQLQMIEAMYLARLLGVNAFDQPAVESYKAETRRLLGA